MAKENLINVTAAFNAKGFNKSVDQSAAKIAKFSDNLGEFKDGLKTLQVQFAAMAAAFTALGGKALQASAEIETLRESLVSLVGGTANASKAISQLTEFAAKTPFRLEAIGKAYKQLVASGSDLSEVHGELEFLGNIAAATGYNINEIAAIYSKVQARGTVQLKQLNQLAERGIPIYEKLAEVTGLATSELGGGAVTVDQFQQAMRAFSEEGGFAEDKMRRLSQTLAGKFSTAADNVQLTMAALGDELAGAAKSVLDMVISFTTLIRENRVLVQTVATLLKVLTPIAIVLASATTALLGMAAAYQVYVGVATAAGLATVGFATAVKLMLTSILPITAAIGLVVAGTVALVHAFRNANVEARANEAASEAQGKAMGDAAASAVRLRTSVTKLTAEFKDHNTTADRKKEILEQLKTTHPSLAKSLKGTTIETVNFTDAMKDLNEELDKNIKLVGIKAQIEALEKFLVTAGEGFAGALADVYEEVGNIEQDLKINIPLDEIITASGKPDFEAFEQFKSGLSDDARAALGTDLERLLNLLNIEAGKYGETVNFVTARTESLNSQLDDFKEIKLYDPKSDTTNLNLIQRKLYDTLRSIRDEEARGVLSAEKAAEERADAYEEAYDSMRGNVRNLRREEETLQRQISENKFKDDEARQYAVDRLNSIQSLAPAMEALLADWLSMFEETESGLSKTTQTALNNRLQQYLDFFNDVAEAQRKFIQGQADDAYIRSRLGEEDPFGPQEGDAAEFRAEATSNSADADAARKLQQDAQSRIDAANLQLATLDKVADKEAYATAEAEKRTAITEKATAIQAERLALLNREINLGKSLNSQLDYNVKSAKKVVTEVEAGRGDIDDLFSAFTDTDQLRDNLSRALTVAKAEFDGLSIEEQESTQGVELKATITSLESKVAPTDQTLTDLSNAIETAITEGPDLTLLDAKLEKGFLTPAKYKADAAQAYIDDAFADMQLIAELRTLGFPEAVALADKLEMQWMDMVNQIEDPAIREEIKRLVEEMNNMETATEGVGIQWDRVASKLTSSLQQMFTALADGTASFGELMVDMIKKLLIQIAALITSYAILNILSGGAFMAGGAFGPAAGQSGLGAFLQNGLGFGAFAEGGAVLGPTLALVGEKPGSRGEAIVPFEKIGQFVDMVGGQGSTNVTVVGNLRRDQIHLSGESGKDSFRRRH